MEIYAELTRKMQQQLDGDYDLRLPPGVQYSRGEGSRVLFIECGDDEELLEMVEDALYEGGIAFQRNE